MLISTPKPINGTDRVFGIYSKTGPSPGHSRPLHSQQFMRDLAPANPGRPCRRMISGTCPGDPDPWRDARPAGPDHGAGILDHNKPRVPLHCSYRARTAHPSSARRQRGLSGGFRPRDWAATGYTRSRVSRDNGIYSAIPEIQRQIGGI